MGDKPGKDGLATPALVLLILLFLSFLGHIHVQAFVDYQVVERLLSIALMAMATELIGEKYGIHGDFGILTYLFSVVHPAAFPLASVALHGCTSTLFPFASEFQSLMLGNEYRATFRGNPNFNEIQSEHKAEANIHDIAAETAKSYYIRESIVFCLIAGSFTILHGGSGIFLAVACFVCYMLLQFQGGQHEVVRTNECVSIDERKGVYAIEICNLWAEKHVGVGYLYDGTFTTKFHVTNGKPIFIGDRWYKPCYYNTRADIVAYGAPPQIVDVDHGDKIIVALSGPYSSTIVTYATVAAVDANGYVTFMGKKSIPGTSGSPFFKSCLDADGKIDYKFAGCIGWAVRTRDSKSNEIAEIAMNVGLGTYGDRINRGDIIQHLSHPGSGKTNNISAIIQQGLDLYGRVYVAGPTRGVSHELVEAYERNKIEGIIPRVLIKDTRRSKAASKLTITTHATALRMVLNKDYSFVQPGLWILDESHFMDKSTQALKHYLRYNISHDKMKGALYEMTATAYSVKDKRWCYCDNSNYAIEDVIADKSAMLDRIYSETRKSIVFVTSIKGRERTSSKSLKEALNAMNKKCIEINRPNFTKSYPLAKKGDYDFILTTNIAECGVNLDADVCYDFQEGPKPLVRRWDDIAIRSIGITKGQYVQRRGRIGRTKPGEYVAPHTKYELPDVNSTDATHLDVALFLKEFDIQPMEPVYLLDEASNFTLSHNQIMYLFAEGEEALVNSPLTMQMVIDSNGNIRDENSIHDQLHRWHQSQEVSRAVGNRVVHAAYWDDRDSDLFWQWKNHMEMYNEVSDREQITMLQTFRKTIFKITRSIKHRGIWMHLPFNREALNDEFEVSADEASDEPTNVGESRVTEITEVEASSS